MALIRTVKPLEGASKGLPRGLVRGELTPCEGVFYA